MRQNLFLMAVCAALFTFNHGLAQPATPFPDQDFFTSELNVPIGSDDGSYDEGFTVDDFVGQLKPGVWSQDTDIPGAWIDRITNEDQVTGQTHVVVLLFQPISNQPNSVVLSRAVFDQAEIAHQDIFRNFEDQFDAASTNPAALPIGNQPPPNFPITTRFGVLSVETTDNTLLLNGKPVVPAVQGNNSLDYVRIVQDQGTDVVIAQDTGGQACPCLYYVVTISNAGATATGAFGNCQAATAISVNGYVVKLKAGSDDFAVYGAIIEKNGAKVKPQAPF